MKNEELKRKSGGWESSSGEARRAGRGPALLPFRHFLARGFEDFAFALGQALDAVGGNLVEDRSETVRVQASARVEMLDKRSGIALGFGSR
jgi:hypothetical protein